MSPVRTSSPPITSGISSCCDSISRQPDAQLLALGAARCVAADRLVVRLGDAGDPVGAHAGDSRRVAVKHVAYEVDGWGVGELWLEGGRVVWHELPHRVARRRGGAPPDRVGAPRQLRHRLALALFRGRARHLRGCRARPRVRDTVPRALAGRCATCRAARSSPTASWLRSPARPAARAAGSFCARNRLGLFVPCHRVVSATGLGSYGTLGARLQAAAAGARGCLSLTTSATSSRRSLRPRTATASPSSPGSSTSPAACTYAAAARSPCTSTSRARRSRAAHSRCCAPSASTRRSAPTSSTRSRRDPVPAARRGATQAYAVLHRAGVLDALASAARAAAAAGPRASLLPPRIAT